MTNELKGKILEILLEKFPECDHNKALRVVNEIAKVVDKDVGEAIMKESTMGEILTAVGLKITSA